MINWKDPSEFDISDYKNIQDMIISTKSLNNEYELLSLFRISTDSNFSIDGPLFNMSAENLNIFNYKKWVLIDKGEDSD